MNMQPWLWYVGCHLAALVFALMGGDALGAKRRSGWYLIGTGAILEAIAIASIWIPAFESMR